MIESDRNMVQVFAALLISQTNYDHSTLSPTDLGQ